MRAMVVALALNIATNAEAACGDFCITYWWKTATVSDVLAKLDAGSNSTERDEWGRTPLHSAAMGGSPRTMQVLLDAGALLRIWDKNGRTPLHSAASGGSPMDIQVLLDAGADIKLRDKDGFGPLHYAAASEGGVVLIHPSLGKSRC